MDLLSGPHMIIVLIVILLIFGPKNLPKLAQSIGQSVRELKKGLNGISDDLKEAPKPAPAQPAQTAASAPAPAAQPPVAQADAQTPDDPSKTA